MCRLLGLTAGRRDVDVKYWLTSGPDSMKAENRRNPDGAGVGWFDAGGTPHVLKATGDALAEGSFDKRVDRLTGRTFVTHVRDATTGHDSVVNTHPFDIDGTLIAHNGGFGDLTAVDHHLGDYLSLVHGDTDSERYAALIVKEADAHGGDVGLGMVAAATWLARNVPLYSLNAVVIRDGRLWALRYPDERALHVARRVVQPSTGRPDDGWNGSSDVARHQVVSGSIASIVVVASERIDAEPDWLMLQSGELITVDPNLTITSRLALTESPSRLLHLAGHDPNDEAF